MLEDLKAEIKRLIAVYEAEQARNQVLTEELQQVRMQDEEHRKQIIELERQLDNLNLKGAFCGDSGDGGKAKAKIERMIKEIDKCISLLEA